LSKYKYIMNFIEIKKENCSDFEPAIKRGAIILFFSDECHHCNVMKPKWNKLKESIPELSKTLSGANIVSVDANHVNKLDDKWHNYASSVPTIISVDKFGKISNFDRERETDKLIEFMKDTLSQKPQTGGTRTRTNRKRKKRRVKTLRRKSVSTKNRKNKKSRNMRKKHKKKSRRR